MQLEKLAAAVNATKLVPPGKHADLLVPRVDLCARALTQRSYRLSVLTAPAGYGKTSVLTQLHDEINNRGQIVGWLSIDEDDNDLGRFLLHFVEAMRLGGARTGHATLALLRSGVGLPAGVLKSTLLNELAGLDQDCFLFLDDYHLIHECEVTDIVKAVLLAPIAHVRIFIGTRDANALPLSKLRLRGELLEMNSADLCFSELEVDEFFSRQNGITLGGDQIGLLCHRTEGWVAGLQFAAIAMRDSNEVTKFLERFSGQQRNVGEFLANEVFDRQPPEVRQFLLGTCILGRFDTALCNAVMERPDARLMLDRLESANLFIFSLDDERRWYRYHHLFADYLQRRLQEYDSVQFRELHRRASGWLAEHGFTVEAIEHALKADDVTGAARLLDAASPQLFANGRVATLRSLAQRMPSELTSHCPQLQLDLAWDHELSWRFPQARQSLALARNALKADATRPLVQANDPDDGFRLQSLMTKLAHREMMLSMLTDDLDATRKQCHELLSGRNIDDMFIQGAIETALMLCNRESFRFDGAMASIARSRALFVEGGAVYAMAFHSTLSGSILLASGHLKQAEEIYQQGREWASRLHGAGSALMAMPSMSLAELQYERGSVDVARELITTHFPMSLELGFVDNLIAGFCTAARVAFIDGGLTNSRPIIENGICFAERYGFARLKINVVCEYVRQLILTGEVRESEVQLRIVFAGERGDALLPGPNSESRHEVLSIAFARVATEQGRGNEALQLLKNWYAFVRPRGCTQSSVRIAVQLARTSLRQSQQIAALRYLCDALELAAVPGYARTFLDEGDLILDQLEHLAAPNSIASPVAREAARKLLDLAGDVRDSAEKDGATQPVAGLDSSGEPLSDREIEILRLAADLLQNREIAGSLCLAESTVKWYWQRIYAKLGVHRRSHAVQRAKRMCLLDSRSKPEEDSDN
ncbi:LuxR C-terminal-related transcriptional regulator [Paraburkholderia oxyphila]|uniref:LuxR C-terminal-related transcriptional regulator n=1 Tax=Paraburkholderia oxyphila TaxID=614212 RepID=UPI00047FB8E9|nr:LuxR C-terminal-related transcriptional regulator [Paraburkholderia oxyphila]